MKCEGVNVFSSFPTSFKALFHGVLKFKYSKDLKIVSIENIQCKCSSNTKLIVIFRNELLTVIYLFSVVSGFDCSNQQF